MKYAISLILLFAVSACSFKKDTSKPTVQQETIGSVLSKNISINDQEQILEDISKIDVNKIKEQKEEGKLFAAALSRGSRKIVQALLKKGFSPYRDNNAYLPNSQYDTDAYSVLKGYNAVVISDIESFLQKKDYGNAQKQFLDFGMTCESLVNLHSEYTLLALIPFSNESLELNRNSSLQRNFIEFLDTLGTCDLKNSKYKDIWIENELLRISYLSAFDDSKYFNFLISLYETPSFRSQNAQKINIGYFLRYKLESMEMTEGKRMAAIWLGPFVGIQYRPDAGLLSISTQQHFYNFKEDTILGSRDEASAFVNATFYSSEGGAILGPQYLNNQVHMLSLFGSLEGLR